MGKSKKRTGKMRKKWKIREIKKTCNLMKPKYGVLTTIGEAHLESFGSRKNIQIGKFELVESLPSDGFAILNGDDSYQLHYSVKNNCSLFWIGIDNKEVHISVRIVNRINMYDKESYLIKFIFFEFSLRLSRLKTVIGCHIDS